MKPTNVLLNVDVSPVVEERWVRWTTHANLLAWFVNFRIFLMEFDFERVESNGELGIDEEKPHRIVNVGEMEALSRPNMSSGELNCLYRYSILY
jgi:hypothetical protein